MNLDGAFGMVEMEEAARRIVQLYTEQPDREVFSITDMTTDMERIGVMELALNGWLDRGYKRTDSGHTHHYNGTIQARPHFWERIGYECPHS